MNERERSSAQHERERSSAQHERDNIDEVIKAVENIIQILQSTYYLAHTTLKYDPVLVAQKYEEINSCVQWVDRLQNALSDAKRLKETLALFRNSYTSMYVRTNRSIQERLRTIMPCKVQSPPPCDDE